MECSLTEEQKLFRQTVRQFALEKLLPNYSCWDRGERFDKSALTELATLGVLGLRIPEQCGGQNLDFVACGALNEEVVRGDCNSTLFLQSEAIITERDVVGFEIGDGVPEIMKGVIAREAFGREYTAYRE